MTLQASVVMPYYENHRTLLACLQSFAQQSVAAASYEIIVADDGSPHPAAPLVDGHDFGVSVTMVHTQHCGQAGATNAGIQAACGKIILLTCADIMAHPQLLALHLAEHAIASRPVGVIGAIPYADSVSMTPFMRYLAGCGPQFAFEWIRDANNVRPEFFYAPNVSVQRDALLKVGMFDARFEYGYQDTDLGKRLRARGVKLIYRSQAVAYHDHPNTLRNFVSRQQRVGAALLDFLVKHPDPEHKAGVKRMAEAFVTNIALLPGLIQSAEAVEERVVRTPGAAVAMQAQLKKLYDIILQTALIDGLLRDKSRAVHILQLSLPPSVTPNPSAQAPADPAC